jgi:hypothetical protein
MQGGKRRGREGRGRTSGSEVAARLAPNVVVICRLATRSPNPSVPPSPRASRRSRRRAAEQLADRLRPAEQEPRLPRAGHTERLARVSRWRRWRREREEDGGKGRHSREWYWYLFRTRNALRCCGCAYYKIEIKIF